MTDPNKAERRERSTQGSSQAWARRRMNETHRKGRRGAKKRRGRLRRLLDRALAYWGLRGES